VRRILAVVALAAALALGTGTLPATPANATGTTEDGGLMVVLDSSGSMAELTADGTTRIAAARGALDAVMANLPAQNRVGLRVFGATPNAGAASCADSQLLVPIGTSNRDELRAAVGRYEPAGDTPIGYALQQADADLGQQGFRGILLVSDGIATCDPDPCEVAAELTAQDIGMRIDVIGFDVDAQARQQLQCIADRGRGDYLDVSEADSLQHALERLSTRAFRPFGVVGEDAGGTADAAGAPELVAGTQYADELGGDRPALHYLLHRDQPGSILHVGVTGRLPHQGTLSIDGTLTTADGIACDATTIAALGEERYSIFTGRLSAAEGSPSHACATAETLLLTLASTTPPDAPVPFELRILEEPWPSNASTLPAPTDAERGWSLGTAADGAAGSLVGGASLNDAPLTEPGSYTIEMLPNEFQFLRVAADWGQQVRVQASLSPDLPAPAEAWGILQVLDPVGADVGALLATDADGTRWAQPLPEPGAAVAVTTAPVRWDGDPGMLKRPVIAGEYYVAMGFGAAEGTLPLPITVTIEVVGEASAPPDFSGVPDTAPAAAAEPPAATLDDGSLRVLITFAVGGLIAIGVIVLLVWLWRRATRRYV
jgi:Ca-activated chloride channel homolog